MPHRNAPQQDRLQRAHRSLEGLSVGDAFGEQYFMSWDMIRSVLRSEDRPGPPYDFTDDEFMARLIHKRRLPEPDRWRLHRRHANGTLCRGEFATLWRNQSGRTGAQLFASLRQHARLRSGNALVIAAPGTRTVAKAAQVSSMGKGSFGNGAAMRAAPIGAYFADDLEAAAENARRSADVTHAHPEAICGAIAVAIAAACAWRRRDESSMTDGAT
jgi:ADP-ribosylglycohydrolase